MSSVTAASSLSRLALIGSATLLLSGFAFLSIKRMKSKDKEASQYEQLGLALSVADDVYKYLHERDPTVTIQEAVESIIKAQNNALSVFKYKCIYGMRFAKSQINKHPGYGLLEKIKGDGQGFKNVKLLDIGCCMGTDIRRIILDGAQTNNVLGVDLESEFIDIGLELFRDKQPERPERPGANGSNNLASRFIQLDILSEESYRNNQTFMEFVNGGLDGIYCGAVFHLLNLSQSLQLAQAAFQFLKPGGIFFGSTAGSGDSNILEVPDPRRQGRVRYLHTVESFEKMMKSKGFEKVVVHVNARNTKRPQSTSSSSSSEEKAETVSGSPSSWEKRAHRDEKAFLGMDGKTSHFLFYCIKPL